MAASKMPPIHPGEILREEFLVPLGMTQKQLADHLSCDVKVVNRIINGRAAVSIEMAPDADEPNVLWVLRSLLDEELLVWQRLEATACHGCQERRCRQRPVHPADR